LIDSRERRNLSSFRAKSFFPTKNCFTKFATATKNQPFRVCLSFVIGLLGTVTGVEDECKTARSKRSNSWV